MAKVCTGVEIGNHTVKIAVCTPQTVTKLIIEEVPENIIRGGAVVSWEAMADYLKELKKKYRFPGNKVAIVLPESSIYIRRITMPAMTTDQLKVNLPYEFHDYITEDKEKYFYDYAMIEMIHDENDVPKNMDLLAVATKKSNIEKYRTMFRRAGMKLAIAAPEVSAYGNIIKRYMEHNPIEESQDFAVLDLGDQEIRLHIYTRGNYEISRSMEPGCSALTSIIAELYSVDTHIAEMFKEKNHEDVWHRDEVVALYNRIGVEVMRVINFYGFNHPDNALHTVYYCGGGAKITPLLEEIEAIIEQKLVGIDTLFDPETGDAELLRGAPAAVGITWE